MDGTALILQSRRQLAVDEEYALRSAREGRRHCAVPSIFTRSHLGRSIMAGSVFDSEEDVSMNSTRRTLIRRGAALVATSVLASSGALAPSRVRAQGASGQPMPDVKALVFDTFGT